MKLSELLSEDSINLELKSQTKDQVIEELVELLPLDAKAKNIMQKMLKKRERLGSTGIGKGVAIPHGRSLVINRLMLAFGRSKKGIDFDAIDKKSVHLFFLIVAPPLESDNLYLPTLGKIAQLARDTENRNKLLNSSSPQTVLKILEELST